MTSLTPSRVGLARALSKLGHCSRSAAFRLIRAGKVAVNGTIQRDPERPVYWQRDRIEVEGRMIAAPAKVYVMLNKPRGVVTTASDEKGRETVYAGLDMNLPWIGPVGRLDKASEGLLLLTNDSGWAARVLAPETHLDKTYHVQIANVANEELLAALTRGVASSEGELRAKAARLLRSGSKNSWLEIVLDEGKNRQIRRMLAAHGVEVLRLVRVAIGSLTLGELAKGESRHLSKEEKQELDWAMKAASRKTVAQIRHESGVVVDEIERLSCDPRVTVRRAGLPDPTGRCVVYWMQRAQRGTDNPALAVAVEAANALGKPVVVFFAPVPYYPRANFRPFGFLAAGIPDIAEALARRNVGFVLRAFPDHSLVKFCEQVRPALVIGDENPLRETEQWRVRAGELLRVPLWTVDADVVVPSKLLGREHYAARTIRPRLRELLPQFLVPLKNQKARIAWVKPKKLESLARGENFLSSWPLDRSVTPVDTWHGGSRQGLRLLRRFVSQGLKTYSRDRNHPELDGTSRLSPYLHFGHVGPLTVALAVQSATASPAAKEAFLEQLIVRRELAVNFVRFNPHYDSLECLEPWADRTFAAHSPDVRPIVYTEKQLEQAETHDPLWNAAQKQMVLTGWMHNYLRMYWAKKILEWSPSIASAYQRAVWLNDRYELDGRDPNGYAGIAWAIVGKHDRAWFERPIFGQIRYMSYASTSRKFDSKKYIEQIESL